ncbi:hypothetical protein RAK27_18355 [Carnobacterium maltaromaticum]|uniref:Uncharacterized protein n=1 Tax=Carnobacterium maltaromaticum TaxID=2751 RepID=A0AAW9K7H0_CARML|nr:hypothetical protein [Carnobacterium maltaromaticum]MDZ5760606.1 hypothetical protein [Carnobacterium maltaromaticum]
MGIVILFMALIVYVLSIFLSGASSVFLTLILFKNVMKMSERKVKVLVSICSIILGSIVGILVGTAILSEMFGPYF